MNEKNIRAHANNEGFDWSARPQSDQWFHLLPVDSIMSGRPPPELQKILA